MQDQHLYESPAIGMVMNTADYYYPEWGCLLDFLSNPVLKNCWRDWGFEPTTYNLTSQSGAFDHLTELQHLQSLQKMSLKIVFVSHFIVCDKGEWRYKW